jgi:hypothetical protein
MLRIIIGNTLCLIINGTDAFFGIFAGTDFTIIVVLSTLCACLIGIASGDSTCLCAVFQFGIAGFIVTGKDTACFIAAFIFAPGNIAAALALALSAETFAGFAIYAHIIVTCRIIAVAGPASSAEIRVILRENTSSVAFYGSARTLTSEEIRRIGFAHAIVFIIFGTIGTTIVHGITTVGTAGFRISRINTIIIAKQRLIGTDTDIFIINLGTETCGFEVFAILTFIIAFRTRGTASLVRTGIQTGFAAIRHIT